MLFHLVLAQIAAITNKNKFTLWDLGTRSTY